MTGHYASADTGRLIALADRALDRLANRTIPRVANS
jgi:hypothetical protein